MPKAVERSLQTAAAKTELEQRILAVMKSKHIVTGGVIVPADHAKRKYPGQTYYSNAGEHLNRLLAVTGYTSIQVTNTVRGLAKQGVLSVKAGTNAAGQPFGIEVITLAVQPEALRVEKKYLDELDAAIKKKMAEPPKKRQGRPRKDPTATQHLEPHAPSTPRVAPATAGPTPVSSEPDAISVAVALFKLVIERVNQPPEIREVRVPATTARMRELEQKLAETRVQKQATESLLKTAQTNLEILRKTIDELGAENEVLKEGALRREAKGEVLSQPIADMLTAETREQFERMMKEGS